MRRFYLRPAYFADKIASWRTPSDVIRDAKLALSLLRGLFLSSQQTPALGVECPICGFNSGYKEHVERGFDLLRCKWCGVFYVHPMPETEKLKSYYKDVHREIRPEVWHQHGDFAYREIVAGLRERLGRSGRVLDVGAGSGRLVELLREAGFSAFGVEIAANEISPDGPIIARNIEDVPHNNQFDAVVMLWVLEHLPDPASALERLHALIRPGGWIVARVPNVAFISKIAKLKLLEKLFPQIFKRMINPASKKETFFEILGPPYHLFGYTPSSLARLLTDFEFEIKTMEPGGPLRTGKVMRDNAEILLSATARFVWRAFKMVFHHDLIVWAQRTELHWRVAKGGKP
jgi:SAM-dependent methyltransferase